MYLVTGGAGFIGSHIAHRLVREGRPVRVLDNFSGGKHANLADIRVDVDLIEGDIRDAETVQRAVDGVEVVFHQAAEPSVPKSIADPATTMDVNVTGTLNMLTAARDAGCRRFVLASTCAVYGDPSASPKVESMLPAPLSPYAISKLTGEQLCTVFASAYGFEAVALRYFNVFGPRQDPNSAYAAAIPRFLAALTSGTAPTVFGDGEQSRDFVYVEDGVNANLLAASVPGIAGRVFNVASGRSVTINQVLESLARATGITIPATYAPERAGDIRHSLADVGLARRDLGFQAGGRFDDRLAATVAATMVPAPFAAAFAGAVTAGSVA
jgi:nucleoside-diphosphate-sugar epimerase